MRIRMMFLILLLSLLSFWMSSCVTPQKVDTPPISKCPPEGYFLIKKDTLIDLMNSCGRTKSELNECLERERVIGK